MSTPPRLRIIFAGTPDFAATHLQGLLSQDEHEVIAVYSQPDRPAGRGKKLKPSPVKQVALDNNIPVFQPLSLKEQAAQTELASLQADLMIVVAYGLILPKAVLEAPTMGCINVHASLLPRWRGAAPIQRAIEAGDSESGVVIMQMDEGLDTGDMLLTARCDITATDTGGSLHDKLAALGVPALNQTINLIAHGNIQPEQQNDSLTCYAPKIAKQDAVINWQQSANQIEQKIRAFNPFPIAYTLLNGERIKIWQAEPVDKAGTPGEIILSDNKQIVVACGERSLSLKVLQLPGGKALAVNAIMNSKAELFAAGVSFDTLPASSHKNDPS